MLKTRNRLLITLAILGILAFRAASVHADFIAPSQMSEDGGNVSPLHSGSDPSNSGEPDGGGGSTLPHSGATNPTSTSNMVVQSPVSQTSLQSFEAAVRWASMFLMARYLGIAP